MSPEPRPEPSPESPPDRLAAARAAHVEAGLRRSDLDPDPLVALQRWFDDATDVGVHEPTAMALATADAQGRPSVRFVLLRGLDERGLAFYTNTESRKADELASNPYAAVVMAWHSIGRQVRASGAVQPVAPDEVAAYFATRPRGSQISAWASPQSRPVRDRAELDARHDEIEARFAGRDVDPPPHWGGYRIVPDEIEFWQQRDSRRHDRFRYRRAPGEPGWTVDRLGP
jgi:pyridoxamine 5'-phosphate oxidase